MHGGDFLAPRALRVGEGELADARARLLGDHLDAFHDTRHDPVLEAGVFAFGRLADDHQVERGIARAGEALDRPELRPEAELAPQRDVGIRRSGGAAKPPLESDAVPADRIERGARQRRAVGDQRALARDDFLPFDRRAGGLEHVTPWRRPPPGPRRRPP